jgi:hypothetical protein
LFGLWWDWGNQLDTKLRTPSWEQVCHFLSMGQNSVTGVGVEIVLI